MRTHELENLHKKILREIPDLNDLISESIISVQATEAGNVNFVATSKHNNDFWVRLVLSKQVAETILQEA